MAIVYLAGHVTLSMTGYLGRVGLICDRLGNVNRDGEEIMQSYTADNVTNNN